MRLRACESHLKHSFKRGFIVGIYLLGLVTVASIDRWSDLSTLHDGVQLITDTVPLQGPADLPCLYNYNK